MGRDVEKARSGDTGKKRLANKVDDIASGSKGESKENKRGWRDVFDNLEYSDGPGDNIYVFG